MNKDCGDKLELTLQYLDDEKSREENTDSGPSPKPKPRFSKLTNSTLVDHNLSLFSMEMSPKRRRRMSRIRKTDLDNLSFTINPDELSGLWDSTISMTMGASVTNLPSESLFQQFQSSFQTFGNPQQVFDVINNFIEICTNTIEFTCSGRGLTDKRGNDISWLMNERNTWRLVYALYKDRATYQEEFDVDMNENPHPLSEKEIITNFYRTSSTIREEQLVIDWLEKNARDEWKLLDKNDIAHYTDVTVAWENTLYQLQSSNMAYKSTREIVQSLDPDAPLREGKPLHDLDTDDEKRLLKQVFFEIRRGQIEKAQELCIHCGQPWRAATLDGWRLFHDPNYDHKGADEKLAIEGNPTRDIWKLCGWRMCEDSRASLEDKAVMGALCGHLNSVIPYCTNWEDLLWAYTRAAVDVDVEREIRDNSIKDYVNMPGQYWTNLRTMEGILKEVGNSEEGKRPDRVIQEMVILGIPSELLVRCSEWTEQQCQPQFLRFLAHLVLVLRLLGFSVPEHLGDNIIKAYVKILVEDRNIDAIAYYCSLLPEDDQIEQYAIFMETVTDQSERQECLGAAEKYHMNISCITEKVVQSIRTRKEDDQPDISVAQEATEEDLKNISALDWLVFYPEQRVEAMWECNALMRELIALGKISTARMAFNKIPPASVEMILEKYGCKVDNNSSIAMKNLPSKADSSVKEYLCHKAYLDAQEGFSHWFQQFHNSKPTPPTEPTAKDFADTVAYEHRLNRYNEDFGKWSEKMLHETKTVKSQLQNIILFPDGGWMVDKKTMEEPRQSHLERLRRICIPQTFALIYKVLESMELYDDVMEIIPLLMDDATRHFEIFTKQQLQEFVEKVRKTANTMVEKGLDPFGDKDGLAEDYIDEDDDDEDYGTPIFDPARKLTKEERQALRQNSSTKIFLQEYCDRVLREEQEDSWQPSDDVFEMIKHDGDQDYLIPSSELVDNDDEEEEEYSDPNGSNIQADYYNDYF